MKRTEPVEGRAARPEPAGGAYERASRRPMPPTLDGRQLAALRKALLDHYDRTRRRLPWRGETDPYRVLVAETMLQQTRVETVERYWGPWLERFPDLSALAAADESEVLEAWEGLGYYRRARNLHRAARLTHGLPRAELPSSYATLKRLPGVGEYTAGAVASIAFGERVPAVDGNVRRVLARLFDVEKPGPPWLRTTAADLVDPERPGDWNQALMDLGATVCRPRAPRCAECPLARWCRAREAGTAEARPNASGRRRPRRAVFVLAVLRCGPSVLLVRRAPEGLLGGLWAFPEEEVAPKTGARGLARAAERIARSVAWGVGARPTGAAAASLPVFEHRFTHLHASYAPFVIELEREGPERRVARRTGGPTERDAGADEAGTPARGGAEDRFAWVEPGASVGLPLPVAQRRLLDRLAALP